MILAPALALALASTTASAHEPGPPEPPLPLPPVLDEGWRWTFRFQLWFPGTDSTAEIGGLPETDLSSSSLGVAPAVGVEAISGRGTWGVLFDAFWASLDLDDGDYEQSSFEADVFWRLPDLGETDIYVGLRWWNLDASVSSGGMSGSDHTGFVDPLVGMRTNIPLSTNWDLYLRGDVGGFGAGSELTWQTAVAFGWRFSEAGKLDLGWRYLDLQYEEDFTFDTQYSGPTLGLTWSR